MVWCPLVLQEYQYNEKRKDIKEMSLRKKRYTATMSITIVNNLLTLNIQIPYLIGLIVIIVILVLLKRK